MLTVTARLFSACLLFFFVVMQVTHISTAQPSTTVCPPDQYGFNCSVVCRPSNDSVNGHFTCDQQGDKICLPGFIGVDCKILNITFCDQQPCKNGGICANRPAPILFICNCTPSFKGRTCETPVPSSALTTASVLTSFISLGASPPSSLSQTSAATATAQQQAAVTGGHVQQGVTGGPAQQTVAGSITHGAIQVSTHSMTEMTTRNVTRVTIDGKRLLIIGASVGGAALLALILLLLLLCCCCHCCGCSCCSGPRKVASVS